MTLQTDSVRRLPLAAVVLAIALAGCGERKAEPVTRELPLKRVSERVYVVEGPNELPSKANQGFMNNPGFVVTSKGVVVIDPGSSVRVGEWLLAKIRTVTQEPVVAVFNTHIHGDHWLGNQAIKEAFPRAVIYAHPKMKARVAGDGQAWIERLERMTGGALRGTRAVAPDLGIEHEETLRLGDRRFRIYHNGPAHTDGDIMVEVVEERVLFTGDNVLSGRLGRMDDGHFHGNIAAIEMALAAPVEHYVPGHGPVNGRATLETYRDYLRVLTREVRRLHEDDPLDTEMKQKIAPKLARFQSWGGFETELGRHIALLIQELEAGPAP